MSLPAGPMRGASESGRVTGRGWYVDDRKHPLRHRRVRVGTHEVDLVEDDAGIVALDEVRGDARVS